MKTTNEAQQEAVGTKWGGARPGAGRPRTTVSLKLYPHELLALSAAITTERERLTGSGEIAAMQTIIDIENKLQALK